MPVVLSAAEFPRGAGADASEQIERGRRERARILNAFSVEGEDWPFPWYLAAVQLNCARADQIIRQPIDKAPLVWIGR